ncbi:TPA: 3-deoxy-manno-octulosonate cytidylyltransferase, partial [Campylobacter fetus subsp. venerealis]|nr:3-deoxy-manno-octulosonate cytidylyltransferase [Campylobacter fetus subsp. venerealis]
ENIEKLEQLRALQSGKKIKMMQIQTKSIGIDTKEDLKTAADKFGFRID